MKLFYDYIADWEASENNNKSTIERFLRCKKNLKCKGLKLLRFYDRKILSGKYDIDRFVKKEYNWIINNKLKTSEVAVVVNVNYDKKTFSKTELSNLKKLEEKFNNLEITSGVFDLTDIYSYEQVKNANNIIKELNNKTDRFNFSPLEKLLFTYLTITKSKYNPETDDENESTSRSIYGVLNSDKIVCVGYAELLKSIINDLDDENLKIFVNDVGVEFDDGGGMHANNIAYIKDDKYKIDGYYYLDSTFDSDNESTTNNLNHFMIEIGQIKNMFDNILDYNDALENESIIHSEEEFEELDKKSKKGKLKNYINTYDHEETTSVSKDSANLLHTGYAAHEVVNKGLFLDSFLTTRKDFKEFLVLKQTEVDFKQFCVDNPTLKTTKKYFNLIFNTNYKKAQKNEIKLNVYSDSSIVWQYLNEHSPHVDIGQIENALVNVLKKTNPSKSKDEISKMMYDIICQNIDKSKEHFNRDSATAFSECEKIF